MQIKAVFFDLYETLVTEFTNGTKIFERNYDGYALLGLPYEEYVLEWQSRIQQRMAGEYPDYFAVIQDMMKVRNLPYKLEIVQYLYEERIKEKMIPFQNIKSDIIELLESIRSRGIKLGLISNCTEEEVRAWHDSQLSAYFDDVIFSYEVKLAKPDPRIYQLACERLFLAPQQCIFIGDGGSNELDGAERAGLRPFHAIWFSDRIQSNYQKLENLRDVLKVI